MSIHDVLCCRCIERLLEKGGSNTELWASYLQIYCENITDLLSPSADATAMRGQQSMVGASSSLVIRDRPAAASGGGSGGVYVEGLSKYRVGSVDDLWELLRRGDENRSTASTNLNETSSRSHAALIVTVIIKDGSDDTADPAAAEGAATAATGDSVRASGESIVRSSLSSRPCSAENSFYSNNNTSCCGGGGGVAQPSSYRSGTLILVDLAGSERATASEGRGFARLEEAKAINLSLSALGNCMSALADGRAHVPYRDSKLTRLLQGCLGSGARTAVVVTLCPGEDSTGESLSALRFASRASKVKVVAKVSKFQDYEAMYKDAAHRIRLLEAGSSAERQLQQQQAVLREREATIEAQAEEISSLRTELQMLKQYHSTITVRESTQHE